MVIPSFVEQALLGKPITVYGDGTQSRCFAHVKDVVGALNALRDCKAAHGQVMNIGNDQEITIMDLALKVKEMTGSASEIQVIPYAQAYGAGFDDMHRRVPNLAKVRSLIGYQPTQSLEDILRDVIAEKRAKYNL